MDEEQGQVVEQSMDDFMGAAFDELDVQDDVEAPAEVYEAPAVEATDDDPDKEITEPETDNSETASTDDESDKPAEEQTITAPQSMSAKDREKFYALPPEQQSWLTDRAKEQEASLTKTRYSTNLKKLLPHGVSNWRWMEWTKAPLSVSFSLFLTLPTRTPLALCSISFNSVESRFLH